MSLGMPQNFLAKSFGLGQTTKSTNLFEEGLAADDYAQMIVGSAITSMRATYYANT